MEGNARSARCAPEENKEARGDAEGHRMDKAGLPFREREEAEERKGRRERGPVANRVDIDGVGGVQAAVERHGREHLKRGGCQTARCNLARSRLRLV